MKVKAAVLPSAESKEWEVREIDVADPIEGEVQVKLAASGLCHSDEHVLKGETPVAG